MVIGPEDGDEMGATMPEVVAKIGKEKTNKKIAPGVFEPKELELREPEHPSPGQVRDQNSMNDEPNSKNRKVEKSLRRIQSFLMGPVPKKIHQGQQNESTHEVEAVLYKPEKNLFHDLDFLFTADANKIELSMDNESKSTRRHFLEVLGAGVGGLGLSANARAQQTDQTVKKKFSGKVVAITGATSGIGEAAAKKFAVEGAKVFFCGRRKNLGREVEKQIRSSGGDALYIPADVRILSDVKKFFDQGVEHFGSLDISYHNAGIGMPGSYQVTETPEDVFDDIMKTNMKGIFWSMKYAIPHLLKKGGVILNMASIAAHRPTATMCPYNASKAAIVSMTKTAAAEFGHQGIRINSLSPGWVNTEARQRMFKVLGIDPNMTPMNTLRRLLTVDEVVDAILFASSPEASAFTHSDFDLSFGEKDGR